MEEFAIPDFGTVFEHAGTYQEGVAAVKAFCLEVAVAEGIAEARIAAGTEHMVSTNGSWTGNIFVYHKDGRIFVTLHPFSDVLKNTEAAIAITTPNSQEEHYLNEQAYAILASRANADPAMARGSGVLYLPSSEVRSEIAASDLSRYPLTAFLFGGKAGTYGQFLEKAGISRVPLHVVSTAYAVTQKGPFARALWIRSLKGSSSLYGLDLSFGLLQSDGGGRVRAVMSQQR